MMQQEVRIIYTCNSNIATINTKTTINPSYIEATGTEIIDNSHVKLKFYVDSASQLNKYNILRSNTYSGNYDSIATIATTNKIIIDTINVGGIPYCFYRIDAINNCNGSVIESNVESTIPLTVTQSGSQSENFPSLTWLPYQSFEDSMNNYSVYRYRSDTIDILSTPQTSFLDTTKFNDTTKSGADNVCYYVTVTGNNPHSKGFAKSNTVCVKMSQKIPVPAYIDPNNINSIYREFKTLGAYSATEFKMLIYDRWGTKVFETSDVSGGWSGIYTNNSAAPQGAYIYYIKLKLAGSPAIEQKGTFVLIRGQ